MGLLTHLQSHSRELIEAGVGSNMSVNCENKGLNIEYFYSPMGLVLSLSYAVPSSLDGGKGFMDPGEKGVCIAG